MGEKLMYKKLNKDFDKIENRKIKISPLTQLFPPRARQLRAKSIFWSLPFLMRPLDELIDYSADSAVAAVCCAE